MPVGRTCKADVDQRRVQEKQADRARKYGILKGMFARALAQSDDTMKLCGKDDANQFIVFCSVYFIADEIWAPKRSWGPPLPAGLTFLLPEHFSVAHIGAGS